MQNLHKIFAVVRGGRFYSQNDLNGLKDRVQKHMESARAAALPAENRRSARVSLRPSFIQTNARTIMLNLLVRRGDSLGGPTVRRHGEGGKRRHQAESDKEQQARRVAAGAVEAYAQQEGTDADGQRE